jgi:hypothetical protein
MSCTKRKRVDISSDGGDPGSAQATTRSEIHWFDDGNIILQAGGKLFKVHCGVLAKNAKIFKDMYVWIAAATRTVYDCPIVSLSDSEGNLHHFLNVIYNPCVPVTV